jgi:tetratricopeptide (TPR) repeat protein
MRSTWLKASATAALVLGLSASLPPDAADTALTDFLSALTYCGRNLGIVQRAALGKLLAGAAAYAQALPAQPQTPPPLMSGLGDAHMQITTANSQAQAYFDQGLKMLHGFNHGEAARAFRYAQELDPNCAMCFWGEAFALGPNINAPMDANNNDAAYRAARAALDKSQGVTAPERALIEAMAVRYTRQWPADRAPMDSAFAQAMSDVADQFAENDLIQILAAEADMDTQPWDYWDATGRNPKGRAGEAIRRIETVLSRSPRNAGANHLYIHLAEASTNPWRAEEAAKRLAALAPAAGHLVHMPAHIQYRVGQFREAIRQNILAAQVDEHYINTANASPIYRYGYYTHNLHFVVTSAQQGGDGATALEYAEKLDSALPIEMAAQFAIAQPVKAAPWFARAQFAAPAAILAAAAPANGVAYVTGAWRYARATAFVRSRNLAEARREAAEMATLTQTGDFATLTSSGIPASDLLQILRHVVLGKAFMVEGKHDEAIQELETAVEMQRKVPYTEPPYVYYPTRRTLGAAYLLANRPALAAQEFLQTLIENPNDAYAYWGLSEASRMRGDTRGAAAAGSLFEGVFIGPPADMTAMSL